MKKLIVEKVLQTNKPNKDIIFTKFNITNSFFSKKNGSFSIEGDFKLTKDGIEFDIYDKKFSFEKKGDKWYCEKGWGLDN